jgi:hypothetical protein
MLVNPWWLMPIISAIQEVETEKIQTWQKISKTPSQSTRWAWWYASVTAMWNATGRRITV